MMDSSLHLVGLSIPCQVCKEPLIVPDRTSSESGSFAHAHSAKRTLVAGRDDEAPDTSWESAGGSSEAVLPTSATGRVAVAALVVAVIVVACAMAWVLLAG